VVFLTHLLVLLALGVLAVIPCAVFDKRSLFGSLMYVVFGNLFGLALLSLPISLVISIVM